MPPGTLPCKPIRSESAFVGSLLGTAVGMEVGAALGDGRPFAVGIALGVAVGEHVAPVLHAIGQFSLRVCISMSV